MIADLCDIVPLYEHNDEEFWHQQRGKGIGGSEIGIICGLSKYTSPYMLWSRKCGLVPRDSAGEAAALGTFLESPVAEWYARQTNTALVEWQVILRSKKYPFMSANVDRFIVTPSKEFPAGKVTQWKSAEEPPGILALYEGKTGALASPGSPHEWFENGESIPSTYAVQGMWYLAVTGLDRAEYGALLGGHGFQRRTLLRDNDRIAQLIAVGADFWEMVENRTPPEVDGLDSTEEALKTLFPRHAEGKAYEGGDALLRLWKEFEELKEKEAKAILARKSARATIAQLLGDAEYGTVDGMRILTFKAGREGTELDVDKLKRDYPQIFQELQKPRFGARTMRSAS